MTGPLDLNDLNRPRARALGARRAALRVAFALLRVYWFVFRPKTSSVNMVLTRGGDVLLVRHTYREVDSWAIPGGGVRRGETTEAAASREALEELGLRISRWTRIGEIETRRFHKRDLITCFHADMPDAPMTVDPVEIAAAGWFPAEGLPAPRQGKTDAIVGMLGATGA